MYHIFDRHFVYCVAVVKGCEMRHYSPPAKALDHDPHPVPTVGRSIAAIS
jgi:hypothetical protein